MKGDGVGGKGGGWGRRGRGGISCQSHLETLKADGPCLDQHIRSSLNIFASQETRRRQQAEAAEKRQKENEGRGVRDPEALKRKQKRREEMEQKAESQPNNDSGTGLRVRFSKGLELLRVFLSSQVVLCVTEWWGKLRVKVSERTNRLIEVEREREREGGRELTGKYAFYWKGVPYNTTVHEVWTHLCEILIWSSFTAFMKWTLWIGYVLYM